MASHEGQVMRNRLRLGSGIIMFTFVTGHLINHALGLISIETMQAATAVFIQPWRTWPGIVLLCGAIIVHMGIALWGFWTRRNFRLKAWEAVQLGFGLAIPRRLDVLNDRLKHELTEELKIGIGVHTGEAIVGSMGPPASPNVSALGDNINVAARLESQTKVFGVPLVVSEETAKLSGIDFSQFSKKRIQVKGRTRRIAVYAVDKPLELVVNV